MQNWLKTQPKNFFFLTELGQLVKLWNRCVEVEGITLKSDISFVSVYLKYLLFFFKVHLLFGLLS
jgi:hypothetical protein